ncbi:MAG: TSUP family transporter, partial [Alphaproteobacteria bacterium]
MAALLSVLSGAIVGLSLGLVGGGGSILAVPLLIYLVGIGETHIAIGTSAVAVAVNALINLVSHARAGNVKWNCGIAFALFGAGGAAAGSTLGKLTDGDLLLALFGGLMIGVALL